MVEHVSVTDPNIHEPKGASTAAEGHIIVSNGFGSTSWISPLASELIEYASIYTIASDTATLGTIGTTAKSLTFENNGSSNGITPDQTNSQITVERDGVYIISFTMSFSTVAAGDAGTYTLKIAVNGVDSILETRRFLSGTNDSGTVVIFGLLGLTSEDAITVSISSDEAGGTDDISIYNNNLTVVLLKAS